MILFYWKINWIIKKTPSLAIRCKTPQPWLPRAPPSQGEGLHFTFYNYSQMICLFVCYVKFSRYRNVRNVRDASVISGQILQHKKVGNSGICNLLVNRKLIWAIISDQKWAPRFYGWFAVKFESRCSFLVTVCRKNRFSIH